MESGSLNKGVSLKSVKDGFLDSIFIALLPHILLKIKYLNLNVNN